MIGVPVMTLALPLAAQQPGSSSSPSVTVGTLVYAQYLYQVNDTAAHQNDFEVSRAYVNLIGRASNGVMGRITTDIFNGGTPASQFSIRLKYAFASWTPEKSSLSYKF